MTSKNGPHDERVNIVCVQTGGGPRVVVSTAAFTLEFGVRFPVSAVFFPFHV